jgi:hypothetical protein
MKETSLTLLFLIVLLLYGMLLRAAERSKTASTKPSKKEEIKTEIKKEMDLVPDFFLL